MLPERLTEIDGRPYVRCYLHGLIPADHRCEQSPGDHFCGEAAHPNQAEGEEHEDQLTSHDEWDRVQSEKVAKLADALLRAVMYLDGFVWLTEPEASELEHIQDTVRSAFGCKTWEQVVEVAELRDARRGGAQIDGSEAAS